MMKGPIVTLKDKLRRYVSENDISISELARRANQGQPEGEEYVSGPTLTRWHKADGANPQLSHLIGLKNATGYPVAYWADDTIDDPGKVGGVMALPDSERKVIENARALGIEEAGVIMRICRQMGADESISRLLNPPDEKSASRADSKPSKAKG